MKKQTSKQTNQKTIINRTWPYTWNNEDYDRPFQWIYPGLPLCWVWMNVKNHSHFSALSSRCVYTYFPTRKGKSWTASLYGLVAPPWCSCKVFKQRINPSYSRDNKGIFDRLHCGFEKHRKQSIMLAIEVCVSCLRSLAGNWSILWVGEISRQLGSMHGMESHNRQRRQTMETLSSGQRHSPRTIVRKTGFHCS